MNTTAALEDWVAPKAGISWGSQPGLLAASCPKIPERVSRISRPEPGSVSSTVVLTYHSSGPFLRPSAFTVVVASNKQHRVEEATSRLGCFTFMLPNRG